jgi:hypothetical protein
VTPAPIFKQRWPAGTVPTVSVLVVAYNQERFIAQCIESVLQQVTDFPAEVIVHDDASTDGTAAIIRAYAQRFPQLVQPVLQMENQYSQKKRIFPTLQTLAAGEFIARCDGDDFWTDSHKLTRQIGFLRQNPGYVLSFHDAVHIDEEGRVLQKENLPKSAQRDYTQAELRELKWGWMLLGTVVQRNVQIDFPPEYALVPNGDNFLPMLLAAHGGAKFQPEVGPLAYRQHPGGIWSQQTAAEKARMHLQSYLQIAAYFVRVGEVQTAKAIIAGRLAHVLNNYRERA